MKRTTLLALAVFGVVAAMASTCFAMDPHAAFNGVTVVAASNVDPMSLLGSAGMLGAFGSILQKVHYTNETQKFQHVGSVTVPPGETREVDPTLLDGYVPPDEEKEAVPADPLADLLKGSIKVVTEQLQGLSADDLARASALEESGGNRKGLLEAISAEVLRRAQANT